MLIVLLDGVFDVILNIFAFFEFPDGFFGPRALLDLGGASWR